MEEMFCRLNAMNWTENKLLLLALLHAPLHGLKSPVILSSRSIPEATRHGRRREYCSCQFSGDKGGVQLPARGNGRSPGANSYNVVGREGGSWQEAGEKDRSMVFKKKTHEKQFCFNEDVREKISPAANSLDSTPPAVERAKEALREGEPLLVVTRSIMNPSHLPTWPGSKQHLGTLRTKPAQLRSPNTRSRCWDLS